MISMAGGDETRVLPSRLMRKWQKLGIILNIANTLAKMRSKDRSVVMKSGKYFSQSGDLDLALIPRLIMMTMI